MVELVDNPFAHINLAQDPTKDPSKVTQALQRSAKGKDTAPTAQEATTALPQATLNRATGQFDVTRIPLSMLRQMQRDPILAFALFYIRAQNLRARWHIESSDPQVAGFIDRALREIYPSIINNYILKLVYGFQACVKRFTTGEVIDWTYIHPETGEETRVWDEGNINAIIWKPFIGLPPEAVEPVWNSSGEFDGIKYTPANASYASAGITRSGEERTFDVFHSLWFVNERESVHNSIWGYPRLGYAYRYWWSFWFAWGLADRHFEVDADPPVITRFPTEDDGSGMKNSQRALAIGAQLRSGSTIALPSDPYTDSFDGRTVNIQKWDIDVLKSSGNFQAFHDRFEQLIALMLRAMMIPPEAFEARGGSAGYNSTSQLQEAFVMSQIVLMQELDWDLNRYVIPQLVMANFSDRKATARKVTRGFDVEDIEFAKLLLQGKANSASGDLPIDYGALLESVGIPRLSADALAEANARIEQQAREARPEPQQAAPGRAGVNENGLYYAPRDTIHLDTIQMEAEKAFFNELTQVGPLKDPEIMVYARQLRQIWNEALNFDYSVAATLLQDYGDNLDLDETFFERFMRRVKNRAQDLAFRSRRVLEQIMRRASNVELERAGLRQDYFWDPVGNDDASRYLQERANIMVSDISETTRDEIRAFLRDQVAKGTPIQDLPGLLRAHFDMVSQWRADRVVRTEIGKAYNMATLFAAQDAGVDQVQAIDAQLGPQRSDPECIRRNGRLFTVNEAFAETLKEHPYGTLQWRIPRKRIAITKLSQRAKTKATYVEHDDHVEVKLSDRLSEQERNMYLLAVVDRIELDAKLAKSDDELRSAF